MSGIDRKLARKARARNGAFNRHKIEPLRPAPRALVTSFFSPRINRHTGKPHEHRREIARNIKRAAKAA